MADPMNDDDSSLSGGTPPYVPDVGDGGLSWDFGPPNPSSDSIDEILNKQLGPLSDEAINGSPLLYTNPQAYFAALRANNPWLFADTVSGGGGGDPAGDAAAVAARAHEFDQPYAGGIIASRRSGACRRRPTGARARGIAASRRSGSSILGR